MTAFLSLSLLPAPGQAAITAKRIADSLVQHQSDPQATKTNGGTWTEETGLRLEGLDAQWYNTANGDYFRHAKETVDSYLANRKDSGEYLQSGPHADTLGRQLLFLYRVTLAPKYYEAAVDVRNRVAAACGLAPGDAAVREAPATSMSLCRAQPFLAEYASVFHQTQDFAAITRSLLQWNHDLLLTPTTPLETWVTGNVQLASALVELLPYYPSDDPDRVQLIAVLNKTAASLVPDQATKTVPAGLQTPEEVYKLVPPSIACFYVYALLKGVRLGYLPDHDAKAALDAWSGIDKNLVRVNADGEVTLGTTANDDHGGASLPAIGALLLAATEIELAPTATRARGQTVLVDAWYNSQQRTNAAGQMESFHYKWNDYSDSGYSLLRHMFRSYGASTRMLDSAPTKEKLSTAQFYLIVSPDIPVKNPNPHYMTDQDVAEIASWVHDGGVLILMENDPPNADIAHMNLLADRFGIHFNDVLSHHILGEQVEDGTIRVQPDGRLFHQPHTLYMKDTCSISLRGTATALLRDRGDVVMATAKYGRGTVFAAVDPWLYNEYTDGRKNPKIYGQFDNFAGGKELVRWLLEQRAGEGSIARNTDFRR